jgi:hypothetical protein
LRAFAIISILMASFSRPICASYCCASHDHLSTRTQRIGSLVADAHPDAREMTCAHAIGALRWTIAAGSAPSQSTGPEPVFTSHDALSLLNTSDALANVRFTVLYAERDPVGLYRLGVAPRRLRRIRINDLIFPEAVRLDEAYGLCIESDVPIVVQFTRQDTSASANARMLGTAWHQLQ